MKKLIIAAAFGLASLAGAAQAQDLNGAFGNTLVVTEPSGAQVRYYFEPDGTFTGLAPDGTTMRGRWEIAGEEICLLSPSSQRFCAPYVPGKVVGDTWEQLGTQGQAITVTIAAGRP
ncbi:MAG: hypothetical protein WDM79_10695 [Terricaulis sp.]